VAEQRYLLLLIGIILGTSPVGPPQAIYIDAPLLFSD
jgi:hypothetical protein